MILHINHIAQAKRSSGAEGSKRTMAERVSLAAGALMTLVEDGLIDPKLLPALRVHLDWIQYKTNFREPVSARRSVDAGGQPLSLAEIAIDLRQIDADRLGPDLTTALKRLAPAETGEPAGDNGRFWLDQFGPLRTSIIWQFNRLFWQRVTDWEAAAGRGFEAALPSGQSDANHPQAIADSVEDFWKLLADLDKRGQLPAEVFALEIGVGAGTRAALWLDRFKAFDEERATGYYPRLRFLLGDYSLPTLDRALAAVGAHAPSCVSVVPMDALNPFKTLSFLRFKILYVHLTNVYDNLPFDEMVRRDGRLYLVEARAFVSAEAADRLASEFGVARAELPLKVRALLDVGPEAMGDVARGASFWRRLWDAVRLEERLRAVEELEDAHLPPGLTRQHLDDLLAEAPDDVRFHISRGAAESFANTLPLLHPRGYLHVQDIFVAAMDDYRKGFRGPGKLDGALVCWVNGALLRVVGARAGYDVHFAPFTYRPGTRTTILTTSQRA